MTVMPPSGTILTHPSVVPTVLVPVHRYTELLDAEARLHRIAQLLADLDPARSPTSSASDPSPEPAPCPDPPG